jgi:hypothetical protein
MNPDYLDHLDYLGAGDLLQIFDRLTADSISNARCRQDWLAPLVDEDDVVTLDANRYDSKELDRLEQDYAWLETQRLSIYQRLKTGRYVGACFTADRPVLWEETWSTASDHGVAIAAKITVGQPLTDADWDTLNDNKNNTYFAARFTNACPREIISVVARKLSHTSASLTTSDPSLTSEEHLVILGIIFQTASTSGMVRLGYADYLFLKNCFTRVDPTNTLD